MIESRFIAYFILGIHHNARNLSRGPREGLARRVHRDVPNHNRAHFYTVYREAGSEATVSYIKGMVAFIPAWICYLFWMLGAIPRFGIIPAICFGIVVYITSAWLINRLLL